ncbi:MAG: hypothetical protein ACD_3C00188G0010 [uncultured bacterium (gcode 4)]|uniref:Uncharacterized protein n=1 Tax=uncultured bacterium (gcode 4) TaxID=1234023 RepID=K2GBN6_9BACT|nr:MAG: hypothetical protein ACD_3C00188G0010 [uncultured bacterium (gcode 4)]
MSKDDQIKILEEEVMILKKKLNVCIKWMRREVEDQIHKIAKRKVSKLTEWIKEDFFQENQEQIISQRIQSYFWDILLLNAPSNTLEYLVHSEINYFNFQKNPSIDGFTVISSYHKILDEFIEHFITMDFRKFAIKKNCTILRVNDPLEKALHLVVNKRYILSLWRLFWLIREIKNDWKLNAYWEAFAQYLDKHVEIKDMLFSENFLTLFKELIDSEVFWAKRHAWKIGLEETRRTRWLMTWEFSDKNSLLYILLESQSVLY